MRLAVQLLGCLVAVLLGGAAPADAQSLLVRREVLALYDSRHEAEPHLTRIHKYAEMPLNHLGLVAVYWDVEKGLPDPKALERYRGVLTWFEEPLARPDAYYHWALEVADRGLRLAVLGEPGSEARPDILPLMNKVLGIIGLRHSGEFVDVAIAAQPIVKNAAIVEFERKLDPVVPGFALLVAEADDVTAHLTLVSGGSSRSRASVLVATSPRGGFALGPFTVSYEKLRNRVGWVLNPFEFFRLALGVERYPVPDVTTLNGRRIYFSHIDGDGWNNISEIEKYKRANTSSAEVVLKELIEPYPDLPVTVGLISGDVDPEIGGDPNGRAIARKLFGLPQVEVGSHTHTHPYNWKFFERYNREEETRLIDRQVRVERRLYDRAIGTMLRLAKKEKPQQTYQRYIAGSDDLPRTYLRRPFELDLEVEGALRTAEQLAPLGKRAMLYQWSGDTTPFEAAVRATRESGVRNINGGDSRFDMDYPSLAYVPPIGRPVGAERQIYAVNSNENTYTNDWTGPFYAFSKLEETLRNTDLPRRLKAKNVYYHMYSGEKPAALAAVRGHLEAARRGDVIPIAASHYAAIADSFYEAEIRLNAALSWSITKRGDLHTVRFEEAAALTLDRAASQGVLGFRRNGKVLYVALDEDVEDALVVLREGSDDAPAPPAAAPAASAPEQPRDGQPVAEAGAMGAPPVPVALPYLVESRWRLSRLRRLPCGFSVLAQGFGDGQMRWAGLAAGRYEITARRGERQLAQQIVEVDASGRAAFAVQASAIATLSIDVACATAS
jgi:hypothetical protein